jgi:hypothetical protein
VVSDYLTGRIDGDRWLRTARNYRPNGVKDKRKIKEMMQRRF